MTWRNDSNERSERSSRAWEGNPRRRNRSGSSMEGYSNPYSSGRNSRSQDEYDGEYHGYSDTYENDRYQDKSLNQGNRSRSNNEDWQRRDFNDWNQRDNHPFGSQSYSGGNFGSSGYGSTGFGSRGFRSTQSAEGLNRYGRGNSMSSGQWSNAGQYGPGYGEEYGPRYGSNSSGSQGFDSYSGQNRGQSGGSNQWGNSGSGQYGSSTGSTSFTGKGPKGYKRSKVRIEEEVNESLTAHPEIDCEDVSISVNESGEVTLSGTCTDRRTKRMIEDVVESVSGVSDVKNELKVQSASDKSSTSKDKSSSQKGTEKTTSH